VRIALGVVAGYVVFAFSTLVLFLLTGRDPHAAATLSFLLGRVLYGITFAVVAGLLAGRIARDRHRIAALSLALVIAAGAVVSIMERPDDASTVAQLAVLLLMAPAALLGDWLGAAWTTRHETGARPRS
jgi:hypothetical protein